MKDGLNLPALNDTLDEVEFFERDRTDRFYVERSHVTIWKWIIRFGVGSRTD